VTLIVVKKIDEKIMEGPVSNSSKKLSTEYLLLKSEESNSNDNPTQEFGWFGYREENLLIFESNSTFNDDWDPCTMRGSRIYLIK
jgi:hypothetical protein